MQTESMFPELATPLTRSTGILASQTLFEMATAGKISFGIFAFTPLFIGTAYALSENDLKKLYLAVGIACMGACISFWINHRYSNWRKWAKENGYVEE